jgi:hypothetical protein
VQEELHSVPLPERIPEEPLLPQEPEAEPSWPDAHDDQQPELLPLPLPALRQAVLLAEPAGVAGRSPAEEEPSWAAVAPGDSPERRPEAPEVRIQESGPGRAGARVVRSPAAGEEQPGPAEVLQEAAA